MKPNPEDVKREKEAAQERMRQAQKLGNVCFVTYMNKPLPELVADREAIREALKESRRRHTVRVRSILP